MPEATQLPTIPTPLKDDMNQRYDVIVALKQAVEHLMGFRGNAPATRTFVQDDTPTAFVVGDQWFRTSTARLSVWDGKGWRLILGGP